MGIKEFVIIFLLLFLVSCGSIHKPCCDEGLKCESDHAINSMHPPELPGTFR